jgi:DNA-binding MarR family transcriptional regulator
MSAERAVDRDALVERTMERWSALFHALQAASGPAWPAVELTLTQLKALFTLAGEGRRTVGELARDLGIGHAGASLVVDRLVRLGLAERSEDPADRRRTVVRLSARGEDLVARLRQGRREQIRRWLERLSERDLTVLAEGLRALVAAAETDAGEPAGGAHGNCRREASVV